MTRNHSKPAGKKHQQAKKTLLKKKIKRKTFELVCAVCCALVLGSHTSNSVSIATCVIRMSHCWISGTEVKNKKQENLKEKKCTENREKN